MSYDISLIDQSTNQPVKVDRFEEGGTYAIGGIDYAELNVTYNYSKLFPFKILNNKKAVDVDPTLKLFIDYYGIEKDKDYWQPTEGNVGYAINILYKWAIQYPDAIFKVE